MRIRDRILKQRVDLKEDQLRELMKVCIELVIDMEDFRSSQTERYKLSLEDDLMAHRSKIDGWIIKLSSCDLLRKDLENATSQRKISRSNLGEHRGVDSFRPPEETSGSNRLLESGEIKEEKVKKTRKKKTQE